MTILSSCNSGFFSLYFSMMVVVGLTQQSKKIHPMAQTLQV